MDFFYAATSIIIGDGCTASFFHMPWFEGRKPKDIAPSIFAISKRKTFTVHMGINNEFQIAKIKKSEGITLNHLAKFVDLWTRVSVVQLTEGTADDLT